VSAEFFAPELKVEVNGTRLAADVSKNITEVSVTLAAGAIDELTLTVANPYPLMPWTHGDKADLFQEGVGVKISMGYVDALQLLFDGEITGLAPSFPEGGTPTLQVTGQSRLHRLLPGTKRRTFAKMTDSQIVQKIASEAGLTAQADATDVTFEHVEQNGTDFDFLQERARRIRYELWMEGTVLHFGKPRDMGGKAYTLVWGRTAKAFDPEMKTMPLRSFTPTMETREQVGEVIVRGTNPATGEKIEGKAAAGDEEGKMGGTSTGPAVAKKAFGKKTTLFINEPVTSQAEADERAKAIFNDRALRFVTGRGGTIGLPDLKPGMVVEIDGVGPRFSGDYYVTRTTHSLGGGGYRTDFSARRNSVG
jgi:phage protein D